MTIETTFCCKFAEIDTAIHGRTNRGHGEDYGVVLDNPFTVLLCAAQLERDSRQSFWEESDSIFWKSVEMLQQGHAESVHQLAQALLDASKQMLTFPAGMKAFELSSFALELIRGGVVSVPSKYEDCHGTKLDRLTRLGYDLAVSASEAISCAADARL